MTAISGTCDPAYQAVRDEFARNFDERGDVGAAVCVYRDGRPVVDLWGGRADAHTNAPWREDTIVLVFSSTKGVSAVCVNLLIQRGLLDAAAAVASVWPEFAAAGKERITIGDVLTHRAGLPYVEGEYTLDEALDWDTMVGALARQAPIWAPGTQHGYHMRTYGWLVGEIVRRVDPGHRSIGTFFREEIAGPLGLDFWIGLPEAHEPRVARLVPPETDLRDVLEGFGDELLLARVFSNPGGHFAYDEMWNTRQLHACELPSSNGIGDAHAPARMYASCVGEVDGLRILTSETVEAATHVRSQGTDAVIMVESCFGLGFMLGTAFGKSNPPKAFGHAGAGGSLAFADPERRIAFAYVTNDLRFDPDGDPRADSLVRATFASV